MSWMRRVTEYLGLAPDDEYEDVEDYGERDDRGANSTRAPVRPIAPVARPASITHPDTGHASVRALPVQPVRNTVDDEERDRVVARPQHTGPVVVRPAMEPQPVASPQVVTPSGFGAAQEVADKFKANRPVIMNLQSLDRDLQRRLIDFASGLCYGLGGHMEKVADQVFLLTPADVQVSEDEHRRLRDRGFENDH
ncbi:MAG: cell division protein SepF [Acidimicrobiales bacterium]